MAACCACSYALQGQPMHNFTAWVLVFEPAVGPRTRCSDPMMPRQRSAIVGCLGQIETDYKQSALCASHFDNGGRRSEIEGMMAIVVKGDALDEASVKAAFDQIEEVDAVVSTVGGTPADARADSEVLGASARGRLARAERS